MDEAERARREIHLDDPRTRRPASPTTVDLGGVQTQTWAYDGQLPGREIRVARGDVLRANLSNGLPQPTTIHWHGIALRNDMDGVPDVTQRPIDPQAAFTYEFTGPRLRHLLVPPARRDPARPVRSTPH